MGCNWSEQCPDPCSEPVPIVAPTPRAGRPPPVASVQPVSYGYEEVSNFQNQRPDSQLSAYKLQAVQKQLYCAVSQEESYGQDKKNEEHLFFGTFFSVLNRVRGYHGTLQRWRNDLQRAHREDTHILDWPYIWREDGIGYLRTLRLVQELVQEEPFTFADQIKLVSAAKGVVKQRKKEYRCAQTHNKANRTHQRVLKAWTEVVETLEDQIC
ncbi:hypothetical protein chiPu_0021505 [Chiloscyllium punctatum]|uniref:Uncharacterized protein n=1 Tax=Chiloscyllium punctatum TaxID=137246 RepID=A0A401RGE6_CHIPU|nr:hypothetical protein [Chiloscyllium punctatum]